MSSPRLSINYPLEIISSIDNLALGTHGNDGKRCLLVNAAGPPVVLLATRAKLERKEVVLGALPAPSLSTSRSSSPRLRRYAAVRACFGQSQAPSRRRRRMRRRRRRMGWRRRRARWWRWRRRRRRRGERPECALTDSCTAASQRHLLLRAQRARLSSSSSSSSSLSSASSPWSLPIADHVWAHVLGRRCYPTFDTESLIRVWPQLHVEDNHHWLWKKRCWKCFEMTF